MTTPTVPTTSNDYTGTIQNPHRGRRNYPTSCENLVSLKMVSSALLTFRHPRGRYPLKMRSCPGMRFLSRKIAITCINSAILKSLTGELRNGFTTNGSTCAGTIFTISSLPITMETTPRLLTNFACITKSAERQVPCPISRKRSLQDCSLI